MKKFKLIIMVFVLVGLSCFQSFAADAIISIQTTSLTIADSGVKYSDPIKLSGTEGYFSTQAVVSGSGTLTISYQLSNSKNWPLVWSTPVGASAIATGLTAGTYLYKFEPYTIGAWFRLSFTETGTSNSVTVVNNLARQ